MQLNIECNLLILEELDLTSLISLAETNKHFLNLAADVLRRRLKDKIIVFSISNSDHRITQHVTEEDDAVKVYDIDTMLKLLKYFGSSISKMEILNDEDSFISKMRILNDKANQSEVQMILVYKFVNLYCSKTLVQLHIANAPNGFFNEFLRPFTMLQNVSFSGYLDRLSNERSSLSEIFPEMRRLILNSYHIDDSSWVDQLFPHMVHLSLMVYNIQGDSPTRMTSPKIERLLANNLQIRSLALEDASLDMLRIVANKLPNLEKLELKMFDVFDLDDEDKIHFEQLKFFKTRLSSHSIPIIIDLNHIEEFETDAFPDSCQRWIEFVETNKHLKKLKVDHYYIRNSVVLRLAQANSNIVDMSLWCGVGVKSESIVKLIENNKQMRTLHLKLKSTETLNSTVDTLRTQLGDNWEVKVHLGQIWIQHSRE